MFAAKNRHNDRFAGRQEGDKGWYVEAGFGRTRRVQPFHDAQRTERRSVANTSLPGLAHGVPLIEHHGTLYTLLAPLTGSNAAAVLAERMYQRRGLAAKFAEDTSQITAAAWREDELFGTVSFAVDVGNGLLADDLYAAEIGALRAAGGRVGELTRLALAPPHNSREVFAVLSHLAYIFAHLVFDLTDIVIEVNPRHVGFYRRLLGFEILGDERVCRRVSAPAVLLHMPLARLEAMLARVHAGPVADCDELARTIYPLFLSAAEQTQVLNALRSRGFVGRRLSDRRPVLGPGRRRRLPFPLP